MPDSLDPSLLVTLGIPALALAALAAIGAALAATAPPADRRRVLARFTLGAIAWLVFTGALAASGLLARWDVRPPPLLLLVVPAIAIPIVLARSAAGARLARAPLAWLIGFHAFRLPLELVMHEAAREGTMPPQMTFTGANLDIVTGATAIVVAALAARGRAPAWLVTAWNALGSLLLLVVMAVAIVSLPLFSAFGDAPAQQNVWVAFFPFHTLPAVLVAAALLGHLVLWRRLRADRAARQSSSAHTSASTVPASATS